MEVSGRFRTVAMFFSHDCEFNCELRKEFLANLLLRALELLVEKFSPAGWPWCLKNVKGIHIWKHCKKCENALSPGSLSRSVLVRHVKVWSKFWRLHVDKVTDHGAVRAAKSESKRKLMILVWEDLLHRTVLCWNCNNFLYWLYLYLFMNYFKR